MVINFHFVSEAGLFNQLNSARPLTGPILGFNGVNSSNMQPVLASSPNMLTNTMPILNKREKMGVVDSVKNWFVTKFSKPNSASMTVSHAPYSEANLSYIIQRDGVAGEPANPEAFQSRERMVGAWGNPLRRPASVELESQLQKKLSYSRGGAKPSHFSKQYGRPQTGFTEHFDSNKEYLCGSDHPESMVLGYNLGGKQTNEFDMMRVREKSHKARESLSQKTDTPSIYERMGGKGSARLSRAMKTNFYPSSKASFSARSIDSLDTNRSYVKKEGTKEQNKNFMRSNVRQRFTNQLID